MMNKISFNKKLEKNHTFFGSKISKTTKVKEHDKFSVQEING